MGSLVEDCQLASGEVAGQGLPAEVTQGNLLGQGSAGARTADTPGAAAARKASNCC